MNCFKEIFLEEIDILLQEYENILSDAKEILNDHDSTSDEVLMI